MTYINPSEIKPIFDAYSIPESVWYPILMVESGGNPKAQGDIIGGVPTSFGLFQLHRPGGLGDGYSPEELLDPQTNAEITARKMSQVYSKAVDQGLSGYDLTQFVAYNGGWPTQMGIRALESDPVVQNYEPKLQKEYTAYSETATGINRDIFNKLKETGPLKDYSYSSSLRTSSTEPPDFLHNLDNALNPGEGILPQINSYLMIILFLVISFGLIYLGARNL